ncbi:hypothetical protein EVAR_95231_1 [Eumeta japonica]|uniref:Uncharacterized protein n=1 Tax=Eumeta variegata TaxID=151549 RepID=A0A4C1UKP4_EUMVA|nr:hypothetical protein EVAR_95231_1 [Eumeta japonica]
MARFFSPPKKNCNNFSLAAFNDVVTMTETTDPHSPVRFVRDTELLETSPGKDALTMPVPHWNILILLLLF